MGGSGEASRSGIYTQSGRMQKAQTGAGGSGGVLGQIRFWRRQLQTLLCLVVDSFALSGLLVSTQEQELTANPAAGLSERPPGCMAASGQVDDGCGCGSRAA